jgi:hypothetical protein
MARSVKRFGVTTRRGATMPMEAVRPTRAVLDEVNESLR